MKIFDILKKYLVSSAMVVLFVGYVVYQRVNDAIVSKTNENLISPTNVTDTIPVVEVPPTPTVGVVSEQTAASATPVQAIGNKIQKVINKFDDDDDEDGEDDDFVPSSQTATTPVAAVKPTTTTVKPVAPTTPATKVLGIYKDGVYNGSAVFARDGELQTQAVIQGGKLTDVKFLVLPNGSEYSTTLSNTSLPKLRSEAIAAQNANVNVVSGATLTSAAFKESLGVALAAAKK